jgi:hypothetical protein
MWFAWMLCGVSIGLRTEAVNVIELNHFQPEGQHRFTQVILWEWDGQRKRYTCCGWWIVKKTEDYPTRIGERWYVTHKGVRFSSAILRETTTDYDPEARDRQVVAENWRKKYW